MKLYFKFIGTDSCRQITKETDSNFIFKIQQAILLGLREACYLNEMQHRQSEAVLLQQHRENIRVHNALIIDD